MTQNVIFSILMAFGFYGCTDPKLPNDIASLTRLALTDGDIGERAGSRFRDLAQWDNGAFLDFGPANPVLSEALRNRYPAIRHRAISLIHSIIGSYSLGYVTDFHGAERPLPLFVKKPFYLDLLPQIVAASAFGNPKERCKTYSYITLFSMSWATDEAVAAVQLAMRIGKADPDPIINKCVASVSRHLDRLVRYREEAIRTNSVEKVSWDY